MHSRQAGAQQSPLWQTSLLNHHHHIKAFYNQRGGQLSTMYKVQ